MTGVDDHRGEGPPWWASGADDLDDLVDPLDAHRRARTGGDGSAGRDADRWGGADGGGAATHDRVVRSTLEDALEVLAALVRAAARRAGRAEGAPRAEGGPGPADGDGRAHDPACRGCPWCTLVRSVGDSRPEVAEHLEQAARHLVQAARAWVDAAEQHTGTWERIPLDDEEQL